MVDTIREHIEIVPGESGPKARIAGHRIRVQDVAVWHRSSACPWMRLCTSTRPFRLTVVSEKMS
jgi:hypothetical protein